MGNSSSSHSTSYGNPFYYNVGRRSRPERRRDDYYSLITDRVRDPDPNDQKTLNVRGISLNIRNNTAAHHTNEFDITNAREGSARREYLVVRRGEPFDVTVAFNRPYNQAVDDLRIVFQFGDYPSTSQKSHVEFILSKDDVRGRWGGWLKSITGNNVVIAVTSAVSCHVGKWYLSIDVVRRNELGYDVLRHAHKDPIYILFNAWCREDSVYLHDERSRQEYVLEEKGTIYFGTSKVPSALPWVYGQFTGSVLDCCLYLLDGHMGSDKSRGDPVVITRKISQLVNSSDEGGMVVGNWSGSYGGGHSPLHWTGSGEIFEMYYRNRRPVKYGQCWVFCGVTTTFCRALGIPCRSVTNYYSAHDTDASLTIDRHYDGYTGNSLGSRNIDSIWNFHCWNDAWMARPDLPDGYGGWQAIDGTPQETSGGVYACGPVSLVALRRGELNFPSDGPFVYAEVNADIISWVVMRNERIPVKTDMSAIGVNISTKKILENEREDITKEYKFPEGSKEERISMERARQVVSGEWFDIREDREVFGTINYEPNTFIGEDLVVGVTIRNASSEARTINGVASIRSMYYTGNDYRTMLQQPIRDLVLKANSEETIWMKLTQREYFPNLTDHCNVVVTAMYVVKETNLTHVDTETLRFRKPKLAISLSSTGQIGETMVGEVTFQNPLDITLTKCELVVEGPGLTETKVYSQRNVQANSSLFTRIFLVPSKTGTREVVVSFNSRQLSYVTGSHKVTVHQ